MNILVPDISVVEKVLRSAAVYLFLLLAFRVAGKRQLGQMTSFDLVVLLVISNVVQNALIGNDNSLGGGLLGATVILVLNAIVAWLTFRYKEVERVVEHTPTMLVRHGRVLRENLRRERLSLPEFRAALRREGVVSLRHVRYVILEEDGHLSDNLGYWIGRRYGRGVIERYGRLAGVTPERIESVRRLVARYGALGVFAARFVPGLRAMAGPLAGGTGLRPLPFVMANVLGAGMYVPSAVGLGYAVGYGLGGYVEELRRIVGEVEQILLVAAISCSLGWLGWRALRARRARGDC